MIAGAGEKEKVFTTMSNTYAESKRIHGFKGFYPGLIVVLMPELLDIAGRVISLHFNKGKEK